MQLIQFQHYQELKPRWKYITDIDETSVFEGLCATEIDMSMYKDISTEKAEAIMEKINKEAEDNGKEEN